MGNNTGHQLADDDLSNDVSRRSMIKLTGTALGISGGGISIPAIASTNAEAEVSNLDVEVDSFEKESFAAYSDVEDRYEFISLPEIDSTGIRLIDDSFVTEITSMSGLLRYPAAGDTFQFSVLHKAA
ncbi:hypothetical protein [Halogeometricum pallidum]|uniref:hypothetical protein n=1 Tax=Halogeometricum pallidum TaxID=411361 RepID=UPI001360B50D|nr:hypothetical protein [Halogeometricum pallidum]